MVARYIRGRIGGLRVFRHWAARLIGKLRGALRQNHLYRLSHGSACGRSGRDPKFCLQPAQEPKTQCKYHLPENIFTANRRNTGLAIQMRRKPFIPRRLRAHMPKPGPKYQTYRDTAAQIPIHNQSTEPIPKAFYMIKRPSKDAQSKQGNQPLSNLNNCMLVRSEPQEAPHRKTLNPKPLQAFPPNLWPSDTHSNVGASTVGIKFGGMMTVQV